MKIGIFDSGLGGLHIANAIKIALPEYNYVYLGDTLHVPYGRRSIATVQELTHKAIDYLFKQHDCNLIIIACNTASARALRVIQQEYLTKDYPERRVLGVIVPTLEHTLDNNCQRVGLLGTEAMCSSGIYEEELLKLNADIKLFTQPAPLLVPMLEHGGQDFLDQALSKYLKPLLKNNIDSLILGCTHYCILKDRIRKIVGERVRIISQDEIIPIKLVQYLENHRDLEQKLSREAQMQIEVTDVSKSFCDTACEILNTPNANVKKAVL